MLIKVTRLALTDWRDVVVWADEKRRGPSKSPIQR